VSASTLSSILILQVLLVLANPWERMAHQSLM